MSIVTKAQIEEILSFDDVSDVPSFAGEVDQQKWSREILELALVGLASSNDTKLGALTRKLMGGARDATTEKNEPLQGCDLNTPDLWDLWDALARYMRSETP